MTGLPSAVHTARRLRRAMSLPEVLLWQELRKRPGGHKFRRQHAMGDYVLDFFCAASMLAVEVDGAVHDRGGQPEYDGRRNALLEDRGVRVIRLAAARVLENAIGVADWLGKLAKDRLAEPPLHHRKSDGPPPRAGEDFLAASLSLVSDSRRHPWNT